MAEVGITQAQKQALIDNLQLEITERARKLRAQYALQSQALRSRLEMRVNRIPQALRKRKMQDLLDEHSRPANPEPTTTFPVQQRQAPQEDMEPAKKKAKTSTASSIDTEKENATASQRDISNPKKRAAAPKPPTAAANTKAARTNTRKAPAPSNVLSPRSHNSRTLARSPFKSTAAASPEKPPVRSPVKATTTTTTTTTKPTTARTTNKQTNSKKTAAASDTEGVRSSGASNTSTGTTVVGGKGGASPGKGKTAAAGKKTTTTAASKTGTAKKTTTAAAAKKENVPPAGGRTLRKRT